MTRLDPSNPTVRVKGVLKSYEVWKRRSSEETEFNANQLTLLARHRHNIYSWNQSLFS